MCGRKEGDEKGDVPQMVSVVMTRLTRVPILSFAMGRVGR